MPSWEVMFERAKGTLPEEDIRFGQLSNEELRSLGDEPLFDVNKLLRRLGIRSHAQQVLVAHLYVDHCLSTLAEQELPNPAALDLERTAFAQKVQLCVGLGVLRDEQVAPLKALNSLRNRISHTLDFQVTRADVGRLRSACPAKANDWVDERLKRRRRTSPLGDQLFAITMIAEVARRDHLFAKLVARREEIKLGAASLNLRRTLDDLDKRGLAGAANASATLKDKPAG